MKMMRMLSIPLALVLSSLVPSNADYERPNVSSVEFLAEQSRALTASGLPLLPLETRLESDESLMYPNTIANCFPLNCSDSPSPSLSPAFHGGGVSGAEWETTSSLDILVAALFLIAAGWLVLAIIYSVLIICIVRMRARSDLDIFDENFGRLYCCPFFCGERGPCYIPLGCILRRHILAVHRAHEHSVRMMTREERRLAMEQLLSAAAATTVIANTTVAAENDSRSAGGDGPRDAAINASGDDHPGDLESCDEPVCSICLMEYDADDHGLISPACVHRFHRECLMDWLERRNNTECPCCRVAIVSDDEVWDAVQNARRQERKLRRRQTTKGCLALFCCGCSPSQSSHHRDEEIHPTGNDIEDDHDDQYYDTEAQIELGNVLPSNTQTTERVAFAVNPCGDEDENAPDELCINACNHDEGRASQVCDPALVDCETSVRVSSEAAALANAAANEHDNNLGMMEGNSDVNATCGVELPEVVDPKL